MREGGISKGDPLQCKFRFIWHINFEGGQNKRSRVFWQNLPLIFARQLLSSQMQIKQQYVKASLQVWFTSLEELGQNEEQI